MEPVRVMIVDDQEPFRRAGSAVVEAMNGFELVDVVETGEESVKRAEAVRPDLVVMDVNLPGMSGLEATRILRRMDAPPVVVLVSTYEHGDYDDETRECGAAAFISKSALEPSLLQRTWQEVGAHHRR